MQVPLSEIHKYGAAEGQVDDANERDFHITALVEKPPIALKDGPAVVGICIPRIWLY